MDNGLPQAPAHFCVLILPIDGPIVCQSEDAKIKMKVSQFVCNTCRHETLNILDWYKQIVKN